MKKGLLFAALALVVVMFGSCNRFKSATVSVLVKDANGPKVGIRVGMFDSDTKIATAEYKEAIIKNVTDATGTAEFEVTTVEFKFDKQGAFQFIVFDDELAPLKGSPLIPIKTGAHEVVEINL